jgi:archaellum component FlaF (FlaF/FlaG flagellin family)
MQGIAKAILISILVSASILLFSNLVVFFPWYMTLVIETFNLSQVASCDNYIKISYYEDALYKLENTPIFNKNATNINITVTNAYGRTAKGYDDENRYADDSEYDKPYLQRGEEITITISANFVPRITLWGKEIERYIPVSFTLKPVGLKHYKDLPFDY